MPKGGERAILPSRYEILGFALFLRMRSFDDLFPPGLLSIADDRMDAARQFELDRSELLRILEQRFYRGTAKTHGGRLPVKMLSHKVKLEIPLRLLRLPAGLIHRRGMLGRRPDLIPGLDQPGAWLFANHCYEAIGRRRGRRRHDAQSIMKRRDHQISDRHFYRLTRLHNQLHRLQGARGLLNIDPAKSTELMSV